MLRLRKHIQNFSDTQVLVIGDIMLDRFIYGGCERISPEAPVPIFKVRREKEMLGAAGNVAANLATLGCRCDFIGIIGRDANGRKLSRQMADVGVHAHLLKLSGYPTIVKTRLIAGNNHLARVDQEDMLPLVMDTLPRFKRIVTRAVKKVDIVLISDYNKGLLSQESAQMIIGVCRKYGKKVIIDPKEADYSKYAHATLVKPNLKEFSEATGRKYDPLSPTFHDEVKEGARMLFEKFQIENLLITLSEFGMIFVPSDNPDRWVQIPTEAKEVFDVSGAGDTALATLGASLGSGAPMKDAMKLANMASGIVIAKLGTAMINQDELRLALAEREDAQHRWAQEGKILSLPRAIELMNHLREQGRTIGFTNGCFDCCHLGHLNSFMQAKELCDVLVVAVNSDACVRRYKGPNRPIQDEQTRALLLASLEMIDYVIVFDEDTPLHIVEALRPDVVAKEGYAIENWPEGQLVQSYGGRAVTLKRLEGYSTSTLVTKMKG